MIYINYSDKESIPKNIGQIFTYEHKECSEWKVVSIKNTMDIIKNNRTEKLYYVYCLKASSSAWNVKLLTVEFAFYSMCQNNEIKDLEFLRKYNIKQLNK
jgi:hypothetical protein|tara:strand:+ start:593 stop:892 length:300 start_codon:yes stop_codon:yes gene_type:complete